ncbi:aminotransferase class V-fold PLP-dependent enzyme [Microbacter margulisiae]|uniref:Cysteine desulfurase n=1 Tax=Microbacter margulisiae TaxID=1350067 RepID=A0A7W5H182_9PORP|nr:cysteine desulfurase [Microbacter margulisiae]MBB3186364.1 cysteine desulfurase/selenocysteine lyase [Microbacter margulisiae]
MTNPLDIKAIRNDFPILSRTVYNRPLIYLDNAATTQKPRCVVEAIENVYYNQNSNIHRGVHYLSQRATEAHEAARATVRDFIHATSSNEIIFTRGTTEAINLLATSYGETFCNENDEIIISTMEHHANIVPWQMLRDRKGIKLKIIPLTETGELDIPAFESLFSEKTKLISVTHVSNVLGTINPIKEIIEKAHARNIPVLIDGAQAVSHLAVDVQQLDVDFYVFSGHKVYGPNGIGVLYGKENWLEMLPPYHGGGEMIAHVSFDKTIFADLPFKFEAGTPDYVGSVALATALNYLQSFGMDNIAAYEKSLLEDATEKMLKIEGMQIFGNAPQKSSVISFLVNNIHPFDMGTLLDKLGIAVRTGHHCAMPLMTALQIDGTARASFAFYNTHDEIDAFIAAIERITKMF